MPHRTRRWIWAGRVVAALSVAGLVGWLSAVGLGNAGQLGSAVAAVVALVGVLAPYLLPPPKPPPAITVTKLADVIGNNSGIMVSAVGDVTVNQPPRLPPLTWPQDPVGEVPRQASAFQPRTGLRAQIEAARTHGRGVVLTQVLSGGGGVGKSQLAAFYAREAIRRGTDLVVWVDAAAPGAVTAAYAQAAARVQARGVTGQAADVEADARKFLEWTAGTKRSWLVVLDDVTDPDQLTSWWPSGNTGSGWVLATTRRGRADADLTGSGRELVDVGVYSPVESAAYLSDRLTRSGMAHLLDEQAGSLAAELGHLPLALSHATAYMINQQIGCATYLELYNDGQRLLDQLMTGDPDGHGRQPDGHSRRITVTLLLALDAADTCKPVGLARPAITLAAVLDPAGHPEALWANDAVTSYLTSNRTPLPGPGQNAARLEIRFRRRREIPGPMPTENAVPVTPAQARAAVLLLSRYGLATYDANSTPRAIRVHALIARAARETAPAGQLARAAIPAADALVGVWPERDTDHGLSQALRDCTDSLRRHSGQILWAPDAHPVIFRCGYSVGNVGLARQADDYWEKVVAISTQNLGPRHPTTLRARLQRAAWHGTAVGAQDTVRVLEELLEDCRRWLEPNHPVTLETRVELARWRGEAGDSKAAVQALEELIAEQSRTLGPDDRQTLHTRHELAYWLGYDGKTAQSMQMFEELVPDAQRVLGPDDPEVLQIRADLAYRQGEAGDPVTARQTFEELVPASVRVHGARHLTTLNYRGNLARWRGDAGDAPGAAQAFEQLLADSVEILGPDHQHVLNTRSDLAHYKGKAGDAPGAVRALEELESEYQRVLTPDHWETHFNRDRLAHWRGMAGDMARAIRAYEELLTDRLRVHGPDHDIIEKTQAKLAHWRQRASGQSRDAQ